MTYKELAKKLGTSPATLSLVINHKPGISKETRKRILEGIKQNGLEDLLRNKASQKEYPWKALEGGIKTICFLVYRKASSIIFPYSSYVMFMEAIQKQAIQYGINLSFAVIDENSNPKEQLQNLLNINIDGMIIYGTEMVDQDIDWFEDFPIPQVVIDNTFSRKSCSSVFSNNEMAAFQVLEYLVELGHKRIGFLCYNSIRCRCFQDRYDSYKKAMETNGLSFREEDVWLVDADETDEGLTAQIQNIIQSKTDFPSVIVTAEDTLAIRAMEAFTHTGYIIPDDISFVGFNNHPNCLAVKPSLTSVDILLEQYARAAVTELVQMLCDKNAGFDIIKRKVQIDTSLIKRNSVKNLNID